MIDPGRADPTWRRVAPGYLVVQALLGALWWVLLLMSPTIRSWFEMLPDRRAALDSFLVADLIVFIGGSLTAAWLLWTRSRWAALATACTAGGLTYATLCLVSWVLFEDAAAAGLVPMAVATIATGAIALGVRSGEPT